jgi:Abortive infection alpha
MNGAGTNGADPEREQPEPEPSIEREPSTELVQALPGLARIAAGAWLRTVVWAAETSVKLARVVLSPEDAARLIGDVGSGLREYARALLGIDDLDSRVRQLMPGPASQMRSAARETTPSLRVRGAELLRSSADLDAEDGEHPAFARVVAELAPDEGRILRLLATDGPQPTIDVRSANLIGVGSQLVAQGINLIGTEAGCLHPDRVPLYLSNLDRLGLIWFPKDPIDNPQRYQVLEAQPDAMEAIKRAGRAKTMHRSVALTAFGQDFCRVVLPSEESEIEALTTDLT